jgi:hypothetical protein
MRRLSGLGLLAVITALVASSPAACSLLGCSLLNAPADVQGKSDGGSDTCESDGDCPKSNLDCARYACAGDGHCRLFNLDPGTACDDGLHCTENDVCRDGACKGEPVSCSGAAPCRVAVCDEKARGCTTQAAPDGQSCEDGDPCTENDICLGGSCFSGADPCAKLRNECVDAVCLGASGCQVTNKADDTVCATTDCADGQCKAGHCELTIKNEGGTCVDSRLCVDHKACHNGYCLGDPVVCAAAECEKGVCVEEVGCKTLPIDDGSACDPGDVCVANATCQNKHCVGGTFPQTYFAEDFSGSAPGWAVGFEWEIGKATASTGDNHGHGDPGTDVTGEGRVAGVVLGGDPDPWELGDRYLTTPPRDLSAVGGNVFLTFHRWLNSDVMPYMHNTVEVSTDGTTWSVVWETSGSVPVSDAAWTFQAIDVTAYKSKTTQVRWGVSIDAGAYSVSSWNIDGVKLQSAPCDH